MAGVPLFLIDLGTSYQTLLLFTMTGAVLYSNNVAVQVDIEAPLEPTAGDLAADLDNERQKVANHAYGSISHGNRDGRFAHIRQWLAHLLRWHMEQEALKLIARCLHEDPRWRPRQQDRDEAHDLATRHGREDLLALLKNIGVGPR